MEIFESSLKLSGCASKNAVYGFVPDGILTGVVLRAVLRDVSGSVEKKLYWIPLLRLAGSRFSLRSSSSTVIISIPPSFHRV